MKYFNYLKEEDLDDIFYKRPQDVYKDTDKEILKYSLGAFLYIPADKYSQIYKSVLNQAKNPKPLAICLEDAIGELGEREAIDNLELVLDDLSRDVFKNSKDIPLIFIRIKNQEQLNDIADILIKNKNYITGIIIPKATAPLLKSVLFILEALNLENMYVIPVIESKYFIYKEVKENYFRQIYNIISRNKDKILGIRIGLADVLGIYGVRRNRNFSIYDNLIAASFIQDVINYLNREELDIPISAGVSEFFDMKNEFIKNKYINEVMLDKYHGFVGKTVIHPNQVQIVQALHVVDYEDYMDAKDIIDNYHSKIGVKKSISSEKMNEYRPHYKWAQKIMKLSYVYGVFKEGVNYNALIK